LTVPAEIRTVLVANRGEIALRILRTCRRLGIRAVAIYTDVDATAPHVRSSDDAVGVDSYLDIGAVVAAGVAMGADAIHPGYGFLSERAEFARAAGEAGIIFVGPAPDVIQQMGRKDHARQVAIAAGVPVVPRGDEAGFPVLVKAAAGGGGKGMRVVRSAAEMADAMAAAKREARAAFGVDALLVEKYVERARHIEVQILGDTYGNVLHMFERDCSTQRRHQKVIEEAPAPLLTGEQRDLVTTSAVALARQAGYTNAGTVEFLLDTDTGAAYFLEMNTRLQVEHPVTEAVVQNQGQAVDLVELQLRVAAGEPLPFRQEDLTVSGHAIEARVYAEDPFGGFLPQAGTASVVQWPAVRVDQALESSQVVSTAYDPMLGKIIVHGADRERARRALICALDSTAILGLTTNTGFLRSLAASDAFRDAAIDTAWLDHHQLPAPADDTARIIAAWTQAMLTAAAERGPFQADGFRLGADPAPQVVQLDREVVVDRHRGTVDGSPVVQLRADQHALVLTIDGQRHQAVVDVAAGHVEAVHRGQRHVFRRPDILLGHDPAAHDGTITAPMPGTVLEVRVKEGQIVDEGEVLAVLEAMKMELSLRAPFAGTVTKVSAATGTQVALEGQLFVIEPLTSAKPQAHEHQE
jgi:3-methylcrotonyl-CoA carboxylase alpha subunit/acetyl-CoA/propionyl-CoA carboxylase biotin carboxyl carrier protein